MSSDFKSRAPAELALPSIAEHGFVTNRPQTMNSSPFLSIGGGQSLPMIFTPESLVSPVDPGFFEGASSSARFGLDIGGTLCKVVYFEPAANFTNNSTTTPSSCNSKQSPRPGFSNCNWRSESVLLQDAELDHQANSSTTGAMSSFKPCGQVRKGSAEIDHEGTISTTDSALKEANSSVLSCEKGRNGCAGNGNVSSFLKAQEDENSTCAGNGTALTLWTVKKDANASELISAELRTLTAKSAGKPESLGVQNGEVAHEESTHRIKHGKEDCNGTASESFPWTGGISKHDHNEDRGRESYGGEGDVKFQRKEGCRRVHSGGGQDNAKSQRQANKLWVSSHEPVHLPGRGTLYFKCFETCRMEEFLSLSKEYGLVTGGRVIGSTGGGARKFGKQFLEIAGLQLERADELKSLVRGIDFLARHARQEIFGYPTESYQGGTIQHPWESPENSSDDSSEVSSEDEFPLIPCMEEGPELVMETSSAPMSATPEVGSEERHVKRATRPMKGPTLARLDSGIWLEGSKPLHPYLVVNIGSGVSILRVDSADKFERVGGTSLGGSTFLGLAAALTGCQSFEEAISLAMQGDSTQVDMLVGDIYGGDYTEMGLAATTVASSFGKLVKSGRDMEMPQTHHLAKALLLMVTNNIGSIAWLHARDAGVDSVMFTGSFLNNNKLAMRLLAVAMEFWSKGKLKAVFLRHEGHAGAVGALLSPLESSNPIDALLLELKEI